MSNYIESYVTAQRPQVNNVETSRVSDLIPEQQRENANILIRLLEDYYRFLNTEGLPSSILEGITKEQDIDRSSLKYIDEIQKEIAKTFPQTLTFNKVSFYKRVVDYYSSRGTEDSALTFFKLFFDETAEIFYPKDLLFRLSEGNYKRRDNINLLSTVTGYTTGGYQLQDNLIGTTVDFFNRPDLSHPTSFYVHAADGDSYQPTGGSWKDLSNNNYHALFRGGLENNYLFAEKAYEFNNGTSGEYAIITNLNYGNEKLIPEMSCFVWMRTDFTAAGATDGQFNTGNWALIDFDRSEVFNLYVNGDGFLAFSGRPTGTAPNIGVGGILPNMTVNVSNYNFDIAANGRAAGDQSSAVDTSLKVNDGNYHYVGVTYSVANQRIILWIDGVAKFVATGDGTLGPLGGGAKRFGVIGDGSEAGTGTDNNDYNTPALNNQWFDGAISAIHLHEFEVCSDDTTIAVDDTNTHVTANKTATTPSTYPKKQLGVLSSLEVISQQDITSNYSSGLDITQSLNNSLRLYYDFGIKDSYESGSANVNDISEFGQANASIICDHCTHTVNTIRFNPRSSVTPNTVNDSVFSLSLPLQLGRPANKHTFVTWLKRDNYKYRTVNNEFVGSSYSTIFSYRTSDAEQMQYLLIRHEDGALGRFLPIPDNEFGSSIYEVQYPASGFPFIHNMPYGPGLVQKKLMFTKDHQAFSSVNKINDQEWHMVAMRADATGNGTIDISVDGGSWENIYTGTDTINAQTYDFDTTSPISLSLGSMRSGTTADDLNFAPIVFNQVEGVPSNNNFINAFGAAIRSSLPFSGDINSFYVYSGELNQTAITNLYNTTQNVVTNSIVQGNDEVVYKIGYTGVEHSNVSSNTKYIEFDDLVGKPRLVDLTFIEKDDLLTGGKYLDRRSFASNINKLHDSRYWQDFSYEVQTGISSTEWLNEFNNLVHPVGLKLFAALVLKIFVDNEWDYPYIEDYYILKRRLLSENLSADQRNEIELTISNLEKEVNSLYRLTNREADYRKDFSWIRDPKLDYRNPTGYGSPTFQPGYLYKDYAVLTFIIEAILTPTDNPITDEEQYWINVGKNYIGYIVLKFISENLENINDRMYSQYALGQLKFIAENQSMAQYKDFRLDQGAVEEKLDPSKPLKFGGLSSSILGFGQDNILPYIRGFFEGAESSTSVSLSNNYVLSNRDTDGDGTTYNNSSADVERTALGVL